MRVHIFDTYNVNKIAALPISYFQNISIEHLIDDFSSASLSVVKLPLISADEINPFDNLYIEDDNGKIIFGGIITAHNLNPKNGTISCLDHRWLFSRLVLDEELIINTGDDLYEVFNNLISIVQEKRQIPIIFSDELSGFADGAGADLRFEIGENIGSVFGKIVKSIIGRWGIKYELNGSDIIGKLFVRSAGGITPEGAGISRSIQKSEDGSEVTLRYIEGGMNNTIDDFTFNFDITRQATTVKIAYRQDGETAYYTFDPLTGSFEETLAEQFGKTEVFVSDYNVTSLQTAFITAFLNQLRPTQDLTMQLSRDFDGEVNVGDRVNIDIKTNLFEVNLLEDNPVVRIDKATYKIDDSGIARSVYASASNPRIQNNNPNIIDEFSRVRSRLDGLEKNYLGG